MPTVPRPRVLSTRGLGTVGIYALAAAVLTGCAFLLYRARRLESAGDVVSVRPMKPVFKYGVAFCVGMVLGVGTSFVIGGGEFTLMAAILIRHCRCGAVQQAWYRRRTCGPGCAHSRDRFCAESLRAFWE